MRLQWRMDPTSIHEDLAAIVCVLFAALLCARPSAADDPSRIPIIDAADVKTLREHAAKRIYATGSVSSAAWSRTGKVMNIEFAGAERRGLFAVVFDSRANDFDAAWDGDFIKAIIGRRLRLYGEVNEYAGYDEAFRGRPQMILSSPEQVTLLPELK